MPEKFDRDAMDKDAPFAEQIAAHLRAPEVTDPSFEKRLMDKVRSEGRSYYPLRAGTKSSWWRTTRELRVSPLTGLAIAAGITAVIALSSVAVGSRIASRSEVAARPASASQHDTVQVVRFVFVDRGAASVELVGDFNAWTKGATRLTQSGVPGVWAVSVPLSPGRHEYAFIINGSHWVADPLAVKASDDFGTESSVLRVGTTGQSST